MLSKKVEVGGEKADRAIRPRCKADPRDGEWERRWGRSLLGYCILWGKLGRALGQSFSWCPRTGLLIVPAALVMITGGMDCKVQHPGWGPRSLVLQLSLPPQGAMLLPKQGDVVAQCGALEGEGECWFQGCSEGRPGLPNGGNLGCEIRKQQERPHGLLAWTAQRMKLPSIDIGKSVGFFLIHTQ